MTWVITPQQRIDADALAYLDLVEKADGQALEADVRTAVVDFVTGCKSDGAWNAIKSSCILAGARTLSGALQPLVGGAPTSFSFVSGDYNRKTGLVSTTGKYLDSKLADNSLSQNSCHQCVFVSTVGTVLYGQPWLGVEEGNLTQATVLYASGGGVYTMNRRSGSGLGNATHPASNFFAGHNRASSTSYSVRAGGTTLSVSSTSVAPTPYSHFIFAKNRQGVSQGSCTSRLAFYSIGEALDLALLDARVTTLINAISAAIP